MVRGVDFGHRLVDSTLVETEQQDVHILVHEIDRSLISRLVE